MFIAYFKKNYEKLISTLVAIIVASETKELITLTEVLKNITKDENVTGKIFIWIIQAVVIMLVSIFIEFLITRFKNVRKRHNIRTKKNFPFKKCTKLDKQKEIDDLIKLLDDYAIRIENIDDKRIDEKLYLCGIFLFKLNTLTSLISNIVYYKEQCIITPEEKPIGSKFSILELNFYHSKAKQMYTFIDEKMKDLDSVHYTKKYQKDEYDYIEKIKKQICTGYVDTIDKLIPKD